MRISQKCTDILFCRINKLILTVTNKDLNPKEISFWGARRKNEVDMLRRIDTAFLQICALISSSE
jgi:hypothetical protein